MKVHDAHTIERREAAIRSFVTAGTAVFGLVAAYVVLAPNLSVAPDTELFNEKRLLQLGVFVGVAIVFVSSRKLRISTFQLISQIPFLVRIGVSLVAFLGILSASQAAVPSYAFLEVGHFALLFATVLGIAHFCRDQKDKAVRLVTGFIVLVVSLYILKFVVGYTSYTIGGIGSLWPSGALGFDNIRFFNQLQTWTLPVVAVAPLLLQSRSKWLSASLYGLASAWWMLLLASGGRGTGLAMLVAGLGIACLFGKSARPWLKRQMAVCAGGGTLFVLFFQVLTRTNASVLDRDLAGGSRPEAWGDALQMMMQSPLLGAGPMHYAHFPSEALWAHPHNGFLQWGAEWGVLSLLIISACLIWALVLFIRQAKEGISDKSNESCNYDYLVRITIVATLLVGAAHTMVSGTIVMPVSQIMLVLIVGWAWGTYASKKGWSQAPESKVKHWALIGAVCMSVAVISVPVSKDLPNLTTDRSEFIQEQQVTRIFPRYWQQGYFGY